MTLAGAAPLGGAAVTLDGEAAGAVKFSGLPMEADVVANDIGPDPARALLGADMGSAWANWLAATTTQGFAERDLTTVAPGDPTRKLELVDALITSVTIPKLDGSSKESGYFDVEFEPEQVRWSSGGANAAIAAPKKPWLTSNFKLGIAGLPADHVAAIDGFTWRQEFARDPQGKFIDPANVGASMKPTALRLTVPAADAPAWSAWRQQFVQSKLTRSGSLKIYAVDLASYATIELQGVGIVAVKPVEADVARFNVELYVDRMQFKLNYADAK